MRIAIATVQAPFLEGGAELHARGLQTALTARGYHADIVTMPFRFFPEQQVLREMEIWESEDFTSLNLLEPERVIALKFPAFYLQHPKKVAWVLHQHRAVYDQFDPEEASEELHVLKATITERDTAHLRACRAVFANSRNVASRLKRYNDLDVEPLYHPPPAAAEYHCEDAQPYLFCPSRIEINKRQDLLIEAVRLMRRPLPVLISGTGGQFGALQRLIAERGVQDRVRLLGQLTRAELVEFYARSLAVFYAPHDEDFGYVTLEAMLSSKPVVTCSDAGGPLEFVIDGVTGYVTAPDPKVIAEVLDAIYDRRDLAAVFGRAGRERYDSLELSWGNVVDRLLAA